MSSSNSSTDPSSSASASTSSAPHLTSVEKLREEILIQQKKDMEEALRERDEKNSNIFEIIKVAFTNWFDMLKRGS